MPSLKIFGKRFTTFPWGQDDLHYVCTVLVVFRIVELVALIPLWAILYAQKWTRRADVPPDYCQSSSEDSPVAAKLTDPNAIEEDPNMYDVFSNRTGEAFADMYKVTDNSRARRAVTSYMVLSFAYSIIDLCVLAGIWSAASVGTPTDPRARVVFLKPLLRFKAIVLNLMLLSLVIVGVLMVYYNRLNNWGCGDDYVVQEGELGGIESTVWYFWFCIILVLQALELLVWPCFITNKVTGYIQAQFHSDKRKAYCREQCMGACMACVGALTCYKGGGKSVSSKGSFTDVTRAMMDFMQIWGTIDVVFSDIYAAFKMLVRVHAEQAYRKIHEHDIENASRGQSLGTGHWCTASSNDAGSGFLVDLISGNGELLSSDSKSDLVFLREAVRYAKYSEAIYGSIQLFLQQNNLLAEGEEDFREIRLDECASLDSIGFVDTIIAFAQFLQNGIDETPYAILCDRKHEEVIITIRGSASLEDMAVDLQLTPKGFGKIGKECGFNGSRQSCHKGVLKRAYWIYQNIHRNQVLKFLLAGEEAKYSRFKLVVTGHSLGAGCAALLAIMLKSEFPSLRCFAFCPPGGLITERLAIECKDYVTSFVNGDDIIPRMSYANMVRLRDEMLEVLARIKVGKRQLLEVLAKPCNDADLAYVNSMLLHDIDDIPKDTTYYHQLQAFKKSVEDKRQTDSLHKIMLFPPGRVIHLARSKQFCVPRLTDNAAFDEILITPTMVTDHSMGPLIQNLEDIISVYENPREAEAKYEAQKSLRVLSLRESIGAEVLEAPDFVCFSRPHGIAAVALPGSLAIVALFCSFLANNHCTFVSRETEFIKYVNGSWNVIGEGLGVSGGLWTYREMVYAGSGPVDKSSSYIPGTQCISYPSFYVPDVWIRAARVGGTLSALAGLVSIVAIMLALCYSYRRWAWYTISLGFALGALLQGMTFFIFPSSICNTLDIAAAEDIGLPATKIEAACSISWGATLSIIGVIMWALAGVSSLRYVQPISSEERTLRWLGQQHSPTDRGSGHSYNIEC